MPATSWSIFSNSLEAFARVVKSSLLPDTWQELVDARAGTGYKWMVCQEEFEAIGRARHQNWLAH
jgi:hypothetical protein